MVKSRSQRSRRSGKHRNLLARLIGKHQPSKKKPMIGRATGKVYGGLERYGKHLDAQDRKAFLQSKDGKAYLKQQRIARQER